MNAEIKLYLKYTILFEVLKCDNECEREMVMNDDQWWRLGIHLL